MFICDYSTVIMFNCLKRIKAQIPEVYVRNGIIVMGLITLLAAATVLAGCSGEARITEKFEKVAADTCEKLVTACMEKGALKCQCTNEITKTDSDSAPYIANVVLHMTTGRLGKIDKKLPDIRPGQSITDLRNKGKRIKKQKIIVRYRYTNGRWERAAPAPAK